MDTTRASFGRCVSLPPCQIFGRTLLSSLVSRFRLLVSAKIIDRFFGRGYEGRVRFCLHGPHMCAFFTLLVGFHLRNCSTPLSGSPEIPPTNKGNFLDYSGGFSYFNECYYIRTFAGYLLDCLIYQSSFSCSNEK